MQIVEKMNENHEKVKVFKSMKIIRFSKGGTLVGIKENQ